MSVLPFVIESVMLFKISMSSPLSLSTKAVTRKGLLSSKRRASTAPTALSIALSLSGSS